MADGVPVALTCRVLGISRSGIYEARGRPPSARVGPAEERQDAGRPPLQCPAECDDFGQRTALRLLPATPIALELVVFMEYTNDFGRNNFREPMGARVSKPVPRKPAYSAFSLKYLGNQLFRQLTALSTCQWQLMPYHEVTRRESRNSEE